MLLTHGLLVTKKDSEMYYWGFLRLNNAPNFEYLSIEQRYSECEMFLWVTTYFTMSHNESKLLYHMVIDNQSELRDLFVIILPNSGSPL